ncbi:hypothetical protein HPB48_012118 [Haemaphysalis longicornis]|uniref:Uncharacterized protein n=1 Tax=Haemaphysalis longicornis TaxID=44386 RepID=A0A9J6GE23_HAELO|nr:hypothetical protein HPB48_012118 [Haemaphysalis longicornis]
MKRVAQRSLSWSSCIATSATSNTELRSGHQVGTEILALDGALWPTLTLIVVSYPCDHSSFCGTDGTDVDDRISTYESASAHNRWDATLVLANVIFNLEGPATILLV